MRRWFLRRSVRPLRAVTRAWAGTISFSLRQRFVYRHLCMCHLRSSDRLPKSATMTATARSITSPGSPRRPLRLRSLLADNYISSGTDTYRLGRRADRVALHPAGTKSAAFFGKSPLNDQPKAQRQLQQLLAQDFMGMGYEARIRHQQRIEALQAECAGALSIEPLNSETTEPVRPVAT